MKRISLLILVAVLIAFLPEEGECQGQVYIVGGGVSFEDAGAFQAFGAVDIPLYTDTVRNFSVFMRTGYQFDRRYNEKENQAGIIWEMTRVDPVDWLYVAIGGGLVHEFKEGSDDQAAGIKLEFGFMPWKLSAFIVGIDYLPDAGENEEDVKFIYAGINLLP